MLSIRIDTREAAPEPGGRLTGHVEWACERAPEALEVRVLWFSEGRGDRDVGVASRLRCEALGSAGNRPFELELPSGPYSFSGRLISLRWVAEATLLPSDETQRLDFVLAPDGREVDLARSGGTSGAPGETGSGLAGA